MLKCLLFDVNETLLDLSSLDSLFDNLFADAKLKQAWFAQLLQSSMVVTMTGQYRDFGVLAEDALMMLAARQGIALAPAQTASIRDALGKLTAHLEVAESLARLQQAGLRLATFTNTPLDIHQAQMDYSGLGRFFEHCLTVEPVQKFKPAAETYAYAASVLALEPSEILFVAAHHWDIMGAQAAGFPCAFIARPGKVLSSLQARPDYLVGDLLELAIALKKAL
jgi:2-haloacid dehalogenase